MSKLSPPKRLRTSTNLHEVSNPLRAAGKSTAAAWIVLVDQDLKARTNGIAMPQLPPSFLGRIGDRIELPTTEGRLTVIGCGKLGAPADEATFWEGAGAAVIDTLRALKIERATLGGALQPMSADAGTAACGFAIGATLASYRCVKYRKQPAKDHFEITELALRPADWKASAGGRELADSINWARALVDAPANLLNPHAFAREIESLEALGVEVEILEERALERIGAGGLLAVGRGSVHPPCMVICRWQGRKGKGNDLGLVGKGVTFDAGGLNLKAYPGITRMKLDMAGAAAISNFILVIPG